MPGGGGDAPPLQENGGEFLLQLLQKPKLSPQPQSHSPLSSSNQFLSHDPAVAAVGRTIPFNLPSPPWTSSNGRDLSLPWPSSSDAGALDLYFHGFHLKPWPPPPGLTPPNSGPPQFQHNLNNFFNYDFQKLGLGYGFRGNSPNQLEQQPTLMFGSIPCEIRDRPAIFPNNGSPFGSPNVDNRGFPVNSGILKDPSGPKTVFDRVSDPNGNRHLNYERDCRGGGRGRRGTGAFHGTERFKDVMPPHELDELGGQLIESPELEDGTADKSNKKLGRRSRRKDKRGKQILDEGSRMMKSKMPCCIDINRLNASLLEIYETLIPAEEEKAKQKQLLTLLEKIVIKEWPNAKLYLYGSCANSFGLKKSDIDICLAIELEGIGKSKVLLKLAELLQSDNLQNVQALTRTRVPIVKLMDPVTGISCDMCVNNVLAVTNTKLLHDYSKIDMRLHQLALIVKHWAKSRRVNETYKGTLSSYAYVLMCINFLQQRTPAILPCLQGLEATYKVTVGDIECAYFDQVDKLVEFGAPNKEGIAQLVWAFFNYWAYCHDYANSVISVRTGRILSKHDKDLTRRVGNYRHLICIEDPFKTSHNLGRVVDKNSIRVLRQEFERAAHILQFDPNPCVSLFEPYVRS